MFNYRKTVGVYREDVKIELEGETNQPYTIYEILGMVKSLLKTWGYVFSDNWDIVIFDKKKNKVVESD